MHFSKIGIVKLLLKSGANVNKNNRGNTPLNIAIIFGNAETSQLLIAHYGANLNIKDNNGWTPLHWVIFSGNTQIVKLFIKHCNYSNCYDIIHIKNDMGLTPQELAQLTINYGNLPTVIHRYQEIIDMLETYAHIKSIQKR